MQLHYNTHMYTGTVTEQLFQGGFLHIMQL